MPRRFADAGFDVGVLVDRHFKLCRAVHQETGRHDLRRRADERRRVAASGADEHFAAEDGKLRIAVRPMAMPSG